jgi:cell division protein FtsQ
MDSPLAGRGAAAQLERILDQFLPLRGGSAAGRRRARCRQRSALALPWGGPRWQRLRSLLERVAHAAGPLWRRRRLRIGALALAVALALLSAGWLWLRHSSFVAVRRVQIVGLKGPQAGAIAAALQAAARRMSTLDVRPGALRAAVAGFPVVRELRVHASFPHGLEVRVVEQPAVAALSASGTQTAVAADGVVLGQGLLSRSLPAVSAAWAPPPGRRVSEGGVRDALAVLGAAPAPLGHFVQRVYVGPKGVTVVMRSGLTAYFGDSSRPHAKWLALAMVLSNERASGASYVDVRVPERPVAGFAPGAAPASSGSPESGSASGEGAATPESVAASIATRLAGAVGREEGPGSQSHSAAGESGSSGGESGSSGGSRTSPEAGAGSEHSSGGGSETSSGSGAETGH